MATIKLISALRLLKQFGDSPEVVSVIDATLTELERLYKIEELAVSQAQSIMQPESLLDTHTAAAILRLAGVDVASEQPAGADGQAQNRMVTR